MSAASSIYCYRAEGHENVTLPTHSVSHMPLLVLRKTLPVDMWLTVAPRRYP